MGIPLSDLPSVDEVVRWASPVQTFLSATTRAVEVVGTTIPAQTEVLLFLAPANHDERRFAQPEIFDIRRAVAGHVGFGSSIHHGVGQMVAKLETEVVYGALTRRWAEPRDTTATTLTACPGGT